MRRRPACTMAHRRVPISSSWNSALDGTLAQSSLSTSWWSPLRVQLYHEHRTTPTTGTTSSRPPACCAARPLLGPRQLSSVYPLPRGLLGLGNKLVHQRCWQPSKWSVDAGTSRIPGRGHHLHQALHIRPCRANTQGEHQRLCFAHCLVMHDYF